MPKSAKKISANSLAHPNSETVTWDSEVPKLGLRQRGAARTWIVQWRAKGRARKQTLGRADDVPLIEARTLARALLAGVETGQVPERSPTVAAFGARYLADMAQSWKPATQRSSAFDLHKVIAPYLGQTPLDQLTPEDVKAWMKDVPRSPASVNRALAVLSGMMRHAELLGLQLPDSNPCKGLRRRKTSFTATYLTEAQWGRLGAALDHEQAQHPREVACIRFLALTGCRRGEALGMRWDMIDGGRCALPDAKSGPRAIWLGRPAKRLLAGLPRCSAYVFGTDEAALPQHQLVAVWKQVRARARFGKLRLHDLRHSFASVAINAGLDLRVVGGLLGHRDLGTTEGYAHLEDRTIRAASQRVGTHLAKLTGDRKRQVKGKIENRDDFRDFVTSSLSLPEFCRTQGLDPARFRRELITWREAYTKKEARA